MKKAVLGAAVVFLFAVVSMAAADEAGAGKGKMHDKKMGPPMKAMMMQKMMEKKMVATSDGGVVVLIGHKLMKYDKNLNLKAEAEIKIDKSEWKKMREHRSMGRKAGEENEKDEAKEGEAEGVEAEDPDESTP